MMETWSTRSPSTVTRTTGRIIAKLTATMLPTAHGEAVHED